MPRELEWESKIDNVNPDEKKETRMEGSFGDLVEKGEIKERDYVIFNGEIRLVDKIAGRWFSLGELNSPREVDPKKAAENVHAIEELNEAYEKGSLIILDEDQKNTVERIIELQVYIEAREIELQEKKLTEKDVDNINLLITITKDKIEEKKRELGIKEEM